MSVASEVTTYHQQDGSTRVHRDDDRCEHRFPLHRVHVFTDVELAAHDAEVAARALREVADDQESMLLEAMDGDFLLVDCGHIGHEDGRVGLSDVRPTDVSRWARDWLRARADRVAGGEGTA